MPAFSTPRERFLLLELAAAKLQNDVHKLQDPKHCKCT